MDAFYTFLADDGWAIASHIALSTLMALFPFLIVLTSLAGFFGSKELADQAVRTVAAGLAATGRGRAVRRNPRRADHDARRHPDHRRGAGGVFCLERRRGAAGRAQPRLFGGRAAAWYWLRLESIGYTLVAAFTSLAMAFLIVLGPLILESARRHIPFFVESNEQLLLISPATASPSRR